MILRSLALTLALCLLAGPALADVLSGIPETVRHSYETEESVVLEGTRLRLLGTLPDLRELVPGFQLGILAEGPLDEHGRMVVRRLTRATRGEGRVTLTLQQLDGVKLEAQNGAPPKLRRGDETLPAAFSSLGALLRHEVRERPGTVYSFVGYRVRYEPPAQGETEELFYPVLVAATWAGEREWAEVTGVEEVTLRGRHERVVSFADVVLGQATGPTEADGIRPVGDRGFAQLLLVPKTLEQRREELRETACRAVDAINAGDPNYPAAYRAANNLALAAKTSDPKLREQADESLALLADAWLDRIQRSYSRRDEVRALGCGVDVEGPITLENALDVGNAALALLRDPTLPMPRRQAAAQQIRQAVNALSYESGATPTTRAAGAALEDAAPSLRSLERRPGDPALSIRRAWWLGATKAEVKAIQGDPRRASTYSWSYGSSSVSFDVDGEVDGYRNKGELNVQSPVETRAGTWSLGATKREVVAVQGIPSTASTYSWSYGSSSVSFDVDGDVDGYRNKGELNVQSPVETRAGTWWLGATKAEVKAIQGDPRRASTYSWSYGSSSVSFDVDGEVDGYRNKGELNVQSPVETRAGTWWLGATKREVVAVQGIPSTASTSSWSYGSSSVSFDGDGGVDGFRNKGELNVQSPVETRAGTWSIGATKREVVAVQGTPSTASTYSWSYGSSSVSFDVDGEVGGYRNKGELNVR